MCATIKYIQREIERERWTLMATLYAVYVVHYTYTADARTLYSDDIYKHTHTHTRARAHSVHTIEQRIFGHLSYLCEYWPTRVNAVFSLSKNSVFLIV